MTKRFWRRVEGRYGEDWIRLNNQYEDHIMVMDLQDYGETVKFFKLRAAYYEVKLDIGSIYLGSMEIKTPVYLAPLTMKPGSVVYVPVGKSRFNRGVIVKQVDKPDWHVRSIDEADRDFV